jgi:hypothetical protein
MIGQIDWQNPLVWLAFFFVFGMTAMIAVAIFGGIYVSIVIRRIKRQAKDEGVFLPEEETFLVDPYAIEGCGYCILLIVALILGALGISLPIVLPGDVQTLIMAIVMAIMGGMSWTVAIWAPFYWRNYIRRHRERLHELLGREPQ